MEIPLKAKHRRSKPTQQSYTVQSGSGNSGTGSKRVKSNHNTCVARLEADLKHNPAATLAGVGCRHEYRAEDHPIRYDAQRGRRVS